MPQFNAQTGKTSRSASQLTGLRPATRARRKFVRIFPKGFADPDYVELERSYKWDAHLKWEEKLSQRQFASFLRKRDFASIATEAIRIEASTNLLFSFEKMALRDALKDNDSAEAFSRALFELLYSKTKLQTRFSRWIDTVACLPRRKTRVLTWPLITVFGFLAQPDKHFFFKPTVTKEAAHRYGVELPYASRPSWEGYRALLDFVENVRSDISDLRPRDMIDLQSFLWIQGSEEYPD